MAQETELEPLIRAARALVYEAEDTGASAKEVAEELSALRQALFDLETEHLDWTPRDSSPPPYREADHLPAWARDALEQWEQVQRDGCQHADLLSWAELAAATLRRVAAQAQE